MISIKTVIHRLQDVKLRDILSGFQFVLAIPFAAVMKRKHKDLWLICEDANEARDNGYVFFKYIKTHHPNQEVVYAINYESPDFKKVLKVGGVIPYGSFKHWVYYLTASRNISSQKGGKPNAAVCYFLEVGGILRNKRVFLQHGITKDDAKWLYYNETKMSMFCCGAKPEQKFVESKFGYPDGAVQYLGFTRFDNLHKDAVDKKLILIMPTWRNWFVLKSKNADGKLPPVEESKFCSTWNEFLNDKELQKLIKRYQLKVIFYPHRNMQPFIDVFRVDNPSIVIAKQKEYDVQMLLRKCAVLITDFSSVFFDVIYMKKPVIFYQFDEEEYRAKQYQEGYFNYTDNPFSIRYTDRKSVISALERTVMNEFNVGPDFLKGHAEYFPLYDTLNCDRTYTAIKNMEKGVR